MIDYKILSEKSVSIKVDKNVNSEEMNHMALLIEALTDGNPKAKICFQIQRGVPIERIESIEKICESIPNHYSVEKLEKIAI